MYYDFKCILFNGIVLILRKNFFFVLPIIPPVYGNGKKDISSEKYCRVDLYKTNICSHKMI